MTPDERAEILAHDTDFITTSMRGAVRQAIEEHYHAGNAITIWRDDRMITVPPDEIPALLLKSYGYDTHAEAPVEHAEPQTPTDSVPARVGELAGTGDGAKRTQLRSGGDTNSS